MHLSRWRRRDDRGAVLILGALFAAVAIVAAALSVDIGSLALSKRANQRIADLASLDGVRGLSAAPPQRDDVERIALASVERNGFEIDSATATRSCTPLVDDGATYTTPDGSKWVTIELGKYTVGADDNFVPVKCPATAALEALLPVDADAVRVVVSSPVSFNFMPGGGRETASAVSKLGTSTPVVPTTTTTLGTTTTVPPTPGSQTGGVRVGSRMASINTTQAAVLNALLGQVNNPLGTPLGNPPGNLNISAVGYDGLAAASMSIDELATELGINAGTVDQVMNAQFSYADLLSAMAVIADRNNQDQVAVTLQQLQTYSIPLDYDARHQTITLDQLAVVTGGAQTFNGSSVADGSLNVLELVRGGAVLADGDHLVSVPLSASTGGLLPTGVTSATASIQLIEAAQYGYGVVPGLPPVSTAQLRTTLTLSVPVNLGSLGSITVNVPVNIEGGGATATAAQVLCSGSTPVSETIAAAANTLTGQTGAWTATVKIGLVNVPISAAPGAPVTSNGTSGTHDFTPNFTDVATVTPAQLGSLTLTSSMITASGLPLGVSLSSITDPIVSTVNPVLAQLNNTVMGPLYDALGVGFASADYSPTQPSGLTQPTCTPSTPGSTSTTTTTTPAPTTTVAPTYSGVPVLVD
jgi:uncharacterized membrane protein